jgi:hypothetical protein
MSDTDVPSFEELAAELTSDNDVKEETSAAPETTESSTEEDKDQGDTEETAEEGKEDEESEADSEEETEKPKRGAEAREEKLNNEIRDLVSTRNALKQEVEQLTAQAYKPQSAEEIMAETGESASDARLSAMEQRQELRDYNDRVAESQLVLSTESQRIVQDFPMFDPASPQFQPEIAAQAANILEKNLIRDPNVPEIFNGQPTGKGIVIGAHASPYELYKPIADAYNASAVANRVKGQQAAEKMLASADPQSSVAPKTAKEDPFLAGLTRGLEGRLSK